MALNFYRRVSETIARTRSRFLHNNTKNLAQAANFEESVENQKKFENPGRANKYAISSNRRTTPTENPKFWSELSRIEDNGPLQPASLPTYLDKAALSKNFISTLQEEPIKKAQTIVMNNSASQQMLELIKKKQAQNHPNRVSKMSSNPFPEPLKAIFSPYTLSDQDKAEQMLQDQQVIEMSRPHPVENLDKYSNTGVMKTSKKFYSTSILKGFLEMEASNPNSRLFSKKTDCGRACEEKPKPKAKTCLPKKCPKMTIKGCPPARQNTICKKKHKDVNCKKIQAPYPSYSESCYMQPKVRKNECTMCPWNEKTNPHFKGKLKTPPKFYHTLCCPAPITQFTNTEGNILGRTVQDEMEYRNPSQKWLHQSNLRHFHKTAKELSVKNFGDNDKSPKIERWPSDFSRNIHMVESYKLPSLDNILKIGYCERHRTVLTDFFVGNKNLLRNFRNGDDLADFGIRKQKLSQILSSDAVFRIACKQGERIIPEYPKDCEKPPKVKSTNCPSGLTKKKTKKERLKKITPKN